jgi:hypothetical protein
VSFFKSKRLEERIEGKNEINEILRDKSKSLIIHYSCESFFNTMGRTPRVTAITIQEIKSGTVKSFSIHLQSQFIGLDFRSLTEQEYDRVEKSMLDDFFKFVDEHKNKGYRWVHWHMRNSSYGFEAIENRYRILGGTPISVEEDFKYDLPRILSLIYSGGYEDDNPDGRLINLCKRNNITQRNALTGKKEADAFQNKEYLNLHSSTLRKSDMISGILRKIELNKLKVKTTTFKIYGLNPRGIIEIVQNNLVLTITYSLILYFVGSVGQTIIQDWYQNLNKPQKTITGEKSKLK